MSKQTMLFVCEKYLYFNGIYVLMYVLFYITYNLYLAKVCFIYLGIIRKYNNTYI